MALSLSEDLQSASSKGQPAFLLIKSTRGECKQGAQQDTVLKA